MWFGFGQTAARNFAKAPSALEYSPLLAEWKNTTTGLLKPLQTSMCPKEWWKEVNETYKFSVFDDVAWEKFNGTFEETATDVT